MNRCPGPHSRQVCRLFRTIEHAFLFVKGAWTSSQLAGGDRFGTVRSENDESAGRVNGKQSSDTGDGAILKRDLLPLVCEALGPIGERGGRIAGANLSVSLGDGKKGRPRHFDGVRCGVEGEFFHCDGSFGCVAGRSQIDSETDDGGAHPGVLEVAGDEHAAEFSVFGQDVVRPFELEGQIKAGIERMANRESSGDGEGLKLAGRDVGT